MTEHKIIFGDSRSLNQIKDKSVQLIITSPPYWQLKDYGTEDQIGFNDSYEEYINNFEFGMERVQPCSFGWVQIVYQYRRSVCSFRILWQIQSYSDQNRDYSFL